MNCISRILDPKLTSPFHKENLNYFMKMIKIIYAFMPKPKKKNL